MMINRSATAADVPREWSHGYQRERTGVGWATTYVFAFSRFLFMIIDANGLNPAWNIRWRDDLTMQSWKRKSRDSYPYCADQYKHVDLQSDNDQYFISTTSHHLTAWSIIHGNSSQLNGICGIIPRWLSIRRQHFNETRLEHLDCDLPYLLGATWVGDSARLHTCSSAFVVVRTTNRCRWLQREYAGV